ncbi:MAG: hypothetical protein RLZZ324_58 [Candidatus Parcubacteria bacterium]|jgi:regulator of protease activity HflC (stomatin/prohibitin superfamily)
MRRSFITLAATAASCVLIGTIGLSACHNVETPAGYAGYVTQGAVFGKTKFVGIQNGPTSSGLSWLYGVRNVSVTPYTYSEPMTVLSKDNLQVSFQIHIIWRVKNTPEGVQKFVEKYTMFGGEGDETKTEAVVKAAYNDFLKEPLRTAARNEVQSRDALVLKEQIIKIGTDIDAAMKTWVGDAPFEVMSVVVGDISYPQEVANAVAKKMAATQRLEQQSTELSIAEKSRQMRVVDAQGIAEAMKIINERLTTVYLQHEAIEAQKAMVGSPNHTTIYIPTGLNGVPLAATFDASGHQASAK